MPCLSCTPKYEPGPDIANSPPILITLSCATPGFAAAKTAKLASTPMQRMAECLLMALLPKSYLFHLSLKLGRLPIAYPVTSQLGLRVNRWVDGNRKAVMAVKVE